MKLLALLLALVGTAQAAAGPQDAAADVLRAATRPQNVSQKSGKENTTLKPVAYPEGEPPRLHVVSAEEAKKSPKPDLIVYTSTSPQCSPRCDELMDNLQCEEAVKILDNFDVVIKCNDLDPEWSDRIFAPDSFPKLITAGQSGRHFLNGHPADSKGQPTKEALLSYLRESAEFWAANDAAVAAVCAVKPVKPKLYIFTMCCGCPWCAALQSRVLDNPAVQGELSRWQVVVLKDVPLDHPWAKFYGLDRYPCLVAVGQSTKRADCPVYSGCPNNGNGMPSPAAALQWLDSAWVTVHGGKPLKVSIFDRSRYVATPNPAEPAPTKANNAAADSAGSGALFARKPKHRTLINGEWWECDGNSCSPVRGLKR